MEKSEIKSMHNLPNILWLSIDPSNKSLRKIDSIVRAFDKGYPQKEGFIDWNSKQTYAKRVPLINYHIPDHSKKSREKYFQCSNLKMIDIGNINNRKKAGLNRPAGKGFR